MRSRILGLLAMGLLAAPMAANAVLLSFVLTDGANNISFQLDSSPTPDFVVTDTAAGDLTGFNRTVSVNGAPSLFSVFFYANDNFGGMSIGTLLNQAGPQIYAGTEASPIFGTGIFQLQNLPNTGATYQGNFLLVISTASVPEPGTLVLLGLGLLGLGVTRRKAA